MGWMAGSRLAGGGRGWGALNRPCGGEADYEGHWGNEGPEVSASDPLLPSHRGGVMSGLFVWPDGFPADFRGCASYILFFLSKVPG